MFGGFNPWFLLHGVPIESLKKNYQCWVMSFKNFYLMGKCQPTLEKVLGEGVSVCELM